MATETKGKARCRFCGSENVELKDKHEEEQYGYDFEGGTEGRTHVGTDVKKDYKCNACGQTFRTFEIRN